MYFCKQIRYNTYLIYEDTNRGAHMNRNTIFAFLTGKKCNIEKCGPQRRDFLKTHIQAIKSIERADAEHLGNSSRTESTGMFAHNGVEKRDVKIDCCANNRVQHDRFLETTSNEDPPFHGVTHSTGMSNFQRGCASTRRLMERLPVAEVDERRIKLYRQPIISS